MKIRRFLSVVTAASALAMLVGCSTDESRDADGRSVLKVYSWKGSEGEPANFAEINDAFEEANPDIVLDVEVIPAGEAYAQRVQPELLAGEAADVIMTDSALAGTLADAGYLADQSDATWADRVRDDITPFVTFDDSVVAMPMEAIGVGLYANMDLLAAAGIAEVPRDWSAFLDALHRLADAGVTPISLPDKGGWTGTMAFLNSGATLVPTSWDEDFYTGKTDFETWRPAVEQLLQLQEEGLVDWRTELGRDEWTDGVADFAAGRTAFLLQGAWNLSGFLDAGLDVQFIAWPGGEEGTAPAELLFVGTMWSVNAATDVREAAQRYVDYWAEGKNLQPYLEAENAINPFLQGASPVTAASEDFVAGFDAGDYRLMQTRTWMAGDVQQKIGSRLQALFLGDIDTDRFLSEMADIAKRER
ncbi:ABC transporter substrate-binding protein [Microbacterium sp. NRRL B-14842]|uniref:ABC transporter substrate-binding protein n=1 Tax=Microbacterium sp. NRRL B-14842 TaxID=3162881 RepID=UPI0035157974